MRRGLRILWNVATLASLLCALAVAALGVRSYWATDEVEWGRAGRRFVFLASERGMVYATTIASAPEDRPPHWERAYDHDWHASMGQMWLEPHGPVTVVRGFITLAPRGTDDLKHHWDETIGVWLGHEVLAAGFAALPLLWLALLPVRAAGRAIARHSARRRGMCPNCGYDLRATPDRCPECGSVPAA